MSTKQLRRYLQENEAGSGVAAGEPSSESEGDTGKAEHAVSNRYAFLEESGEGGDEGCGGIEETVTEKKTEKKVVKKKRKGKKRTNNRNNTDIDLDTDSLDRYLLKTPPKHEDMIFESDLFKIDCRMLNVENELRSILGRRTTETGPRGRVVFGKIVKRKPFWPEVRNVGLSMTLDRREDGILWFKFVHHNYYRDLQERFWMASDSLDHNFISNILVECPYHLDSLLIMAELLRQQEDYQLSRDLIERGLFCCENVFAARFQLCNFDHRIDYDDFENRAFYLLLHRHLRNLLDRHCFTTALHVAKLIFRLDPVGDPLAIMLAFDSIALKAREYDYLIKLYETLLLSRNLDRLPNFAYSVALAHFLLFHENGNTDDKELADSMLTAAVRHFPTVLLKLLDAVNVQPDPAVENNKYMNALAHERECEGIRLLTSIYVKSTSSLWLQDPAVLPWLESITTATVTSFESHKSELEQWTKLRKMCYVGVPRNIERHAYLWDVVRNAEWILTNPAPPYNGRTTYTRAGNTPLPDSFLSGLFHSLWPRYNQGQRLTDSIEEALNALRGIFLAEGFTGAGAEAAANDGNGDSGAAAGNQEQRNEAAGANLEEEEEVMGEHEHRPDGGDDNGEARGGAH